MRPRRSRCLGELDLSEVGVPRLIQVDSEGKVRVVRERFLEGEGQVLRDTNTAHMPYMSMSCSSVSREQGQTIAWVAGLTVHQPSGQPTSGLLLLQTLLPFFGCRL